MFEGLTVKVVIPVLNEEASIGKVLADVPDWVDGVIVVDNGSTDATAAVAAGCGALVAGEPRRGYGQACLTGLENIDRCDVVVFLDGDYSDYPRQMDRLVAPISRGRAEMVIGSRIRGRAATGALSVPQRFGNAMACCLMNLFWRSGYSDLGPFRAVRAAALRGLRMSDRNYGWTIEMQIKAARAGLRAIEVPVDYRCRIGRSKISGTVKGILGAGGKILWTILRQGLFPAPLHTAKPNKLAIFTRYPMPGSAKTRLVPHIGAIAAARLQRRMTEDTVREARPLGSRGVDVEVRYAGGGGRKMRAWLGGALTYTAQGAGDLGERLARAFDEAFDEGCEKVVVIGTDCPAVRASHITEAFESLAGCDVVLGPSTDGGYWLVAMARCGRIFDGIEWGTDRVLGGTLALAEARGLAVAMLEELRDVDRPDDLARSGLAPLGDDPYISVIMPVLNEADGIAAAIGSARCDGVEIIVVDGGSSDQTARIAAAAGARVVTCPPGRGGQMNCGARLARGEVLLFLHGDTVLPADFASYVFDAMSDGGVVGGAFEHKADFDSLAMAVLEKLVHLRSKNLKMPYGDQAIFVRREVFESMGGYKDVPVAEDMDIVRRLGRLGRVVIAPAVAVTSGRRWRRLGPLRTTVINQLVVAGALLGVRGKLLARLYGV